MLLDSSPHCREHNLRPTVWPAACALWRLIAIFAANMPTWPRCPGRGEL